MGAAQKICVRSSKRGFKVHGSTGPWLNTHIGSDMNRSMSAEGSLLDGMAATALERKYFVRYGDMKESIVTSVSALRKGCSSVAW